MRKLVLLLSIALMSSNFCSAQEWFTSFDVAKRLAVVQDKMLFVMWEESLDYSYPILYNAQNGNLVIIDLSEDNSMDTLIWEHFVPVLLPESKYNDFIKDSKGEKYAKYMAKLNDDSIKIMDVNGNILNIKPLYENEQNLSLLIKKYALNTSFLKQELINYTKKENLTTAFSLASKYLDYSIFVQISVRPEMIELAHMYLDESRRYLVVSDLKNKDAFLQRLDLFAMKAHLILDNPRKAKRLLKRLTESKIHSINKSIYAFINYTTFKLLKDEERAALWKAKISKVDLKKAEFIINNNI